MNELQLSGPRLAEVDLVAEARAFVSDELARERVAPILEVALVTSRDGPGALHAVGTRLLGLLESTVFSADALVPAHPIVRAACRLYGHRALDRFRLRGFGARVPGTQTEITPALEALAAAGDYPFDPEAMVADVAEWIVSAAPHVRWDPTRRFDEQFLDTAGPGQIVLLLIETLRQKQAFET